MKSAYELAIGRTGGSLEKIDEDKKLQIAELEKKFKSKIAEAEINAQKRINEAGGTPEAIEQIANDLTVEKASINSKLEREKNAVRNS
jgi:hypothetical protein